MITLYGIALGLLLLSTYVLVTTMAKGGKARLGLLCVLGLVVLSSLLYSYWGNFSAAKNWQQQAEHYQLEQQLYEAGGINGAIKRISAHLEVDPSDAKGWFLLGQLYYSEQQLLLSEQCFAKAYGLQASPAHALAYSKTLIVSGTDKAYAQAEHILSQALHNAPNNIELLNMRALLAYQQGKPQQAKAYWQRILVLLPADDPDRTVYQDSIDSL